MTISSTEQNGQSNVREEDSSHFHFYEEIKMNRKNALQMVENCRITSLGKFAHGYVVYQQASNGIINQVFDHFEAQIANIYFAVFYEIHRI